MTGAIIGDIVGSRFEFKNYKGKDFKFLTDDCRYTDDTVMTLAVAKSLINYDIKSLYDSVIYNMQDMGRKDIYAGYADKFKNWILSINPQPYNSWGNGAAMRISPAGWAAYNLNDSINIAKIITNTTHNHEESIKAASAVTELIYLSINNYGMKDLNTVANGYYNLDFTLDEIRPTYKFYVSCQKSVPYAIKAFLESNSFEDAIRNAISIGGDSDTLGAITGSIAEAYYGVPNDIRRELPKYLPTEYLVIIDAFEDLYGYK